MKDLIEKLRHEIENGDVSNQLSILEDIENMWDDAKSEFDEIEDYVARFKKSVR